MVMENAIKKQTKKDEMSLLFLVWNLDTDMEDCPRKFIKWQCHAGQCD